MKTIIKQPRVESVFPVSKWKFRKCWNLLKKFKFFSLPFAKTFFGALCVFAPSKYVCTLFFPSLRRFNFFSMKLNLLCSNSLIKEREIVFRNYPSSFPGRKKVFFCRFIGMGKKIIARVLWSVFFKVCGWSAKFQKIVAN